MGEGRHLARARDFPLTTRGQPNGGKRDPKTGRKKRRGSKKGSKTPPQTQQRGGEQEADRGQNSGLEGKIL